MKILVIGRPVNFQECQNKFKDHTFTFAQYYAEAENAISDHDIIFDFIIDQQPQQFALYADKPLTVFLNTCNITLSQLAHAFDNKMQCRVFGFNGLPTMLNRNMLEVSVWKQDLVGLLKSICTQLDSEYVLVDDRVGLVTPRVIAMIINEAYYTVQEGTASREDIDLAMKLGTNYPYGPFEWCDRIGLTYIFELLRAIHEDTKDERYKICPLLKKEYLNIKH